MKFKTGEKNSPVYLALLSGNGCIYIVREKYTSNDESISYYLLVLRIRNRTFLGLPDPDPLVRGRDPSPDPIQGWKKPGFLKKTQPSVFYWFFFDFLVFLGFICLDDRVFRVFSSSTNTFRCIQTLNYNHSY